MKLTHVKPLLTADRAPWGPNFDEMKKPVEFQNEGVRRDAVIHVVKEMRKALDAGDQERVKKLHQALQLLIGSYVGQMLTNLGWTASGSTDYGWAIDNEFLEGETGFRAVGASAGVLEYTGNSKEPIPKADPDEYITIASPVDYDVTENGPRRNSAQRTVLIDQPGLKDEDGNGEKPPKPSDSEKPSESTKPEKPSESTTPTKPSEPKPSKPQKPSESTTLPKPGKGEKPRKVEISTNAEVAAGEELAEGATVVDEVHFEGLTPGKKYTLEGELICKATEEPTGAKASLDFVAIESEGSIKLPIKVTDGECGEQVVFETLRDSDGEIIATHHDVNDEAQTVTREDEPKPKDESEEPVDDKPEGENVTILLDDRPEVGTPSAPNAERQEITSVPTGSDRLAPGIPAYV